MQGGKNKHKASLVEIYFGPQTRAPLEFRVGFEEVDNTGRIPFRGVLYPNYL
jgi:hypothetical protein